MSFAILETESKIIEDTMVFRIVATDDFEIKKEKILKGTFGGWVDRSSKISSDSWIDSDSVVIKGSNIEKETHIKNSKINNCNLSSCIISNSSFSNCSIVESTLAEIPFAETSAFNYSTVSKTKIIGAAVFFKTKVTDSVINGNITFHGCSITDSVLMTDKKVNKIGAYLAKNTISDSNIVFMHNKNNTATKSRIYESTITGNNDLRGILNIHKSKIINNVKLFGNITIENSTLYNGYKYGTTLSGKRIGVICTKKIIEEIKSGASLNEEDAFIEVPIGTATVIRCDAVKKFYSIESESRDTEKTLKEIVKKYKINTAMLLDGANSKDKNLKYLLSETFLFDQKKKLGKLVDLNSASEDIKYLINICLLVIQLAIFYSNKNKSFEKHLNCLIRNHHINIFEKRCAWEEILFISDELLFLLKTIEKNVKLDGLDIVHIQNDKYWVDFLK